MLKKIKRYSNDFGEDMELYIQNRNQIAHNEYEISFYMKEIKEAIQKENWFYMYDIFEDNLFFEYIDKRFVHKRLTAYIDEHGADDFISNLEERFKGNIDSYFFVLDFIF